jgi:uncharacterized protein
MFLQGMQGSPESCRREFPVSKPGVTKPSKFDPRNFDPRNVDIFALASRGEAWDGEVPLVRLLRLVEGLPEQRGQARWDARGAVGRGIGKTGVISGQPLVHLRVQADFTLECQRCGQLFTYPVDAENTLQLVQSEDDLDEPDSEVLQESIEEKSGNFAENLPEKVVGSRHFDLLAQVEDELILNVPYVPRHEACPGTQASAGEASQEPVEKRPSPFAVLEQLKRKS